MDPSGYQSNFTYDAAGRLITHAIVGAATRNYIYDAVGQVVSIFEFDGTGALAERWTYSYDKVGNKMHAEDHEGNVTDYTYDNKNRLTKSSTTGPQAFIANYSYDAVDNRTFTDESGTPTTSTFDAAQRIVTSIGGGVTTTFSFDANGNMTLVNTAGSFDLTPF